MGLMDTVQQVMKGRSEMIERAIDSAVERFGRYGETLKQRGETAKAKARSLDTERRPSGNADVDGGPASARAEEPRPTVDTAAVPTTGSLLRGDLSGQPDE